jgi:sigma-B regulation protein RsbU (phosphoserine phosphatase)
MGIYTLPIILLSLAFIISSTLAMIFYRAKNRKNGNPAQEEKGQMLVQSAAMESAANGIIITDTRGVIQWVNPAFCRLTGYSFEESVGHNLKMLNSGVHDQEFFKNLWTTILSGEVWHNEIVNKRKDGGLYTEEMTITPVLDADKKIIRFVAIKQDITARKKLEQMVLLEKERMGSELDVARKIQMSMLPKGFGNSTGREDITITAQLIPAREVGGDFYDYYWMDDENFCFFIGDVSGKGVPAALHMAVSKTLLKAGSSNEKSTARILTQVNNELSRDNDNYMFVTVFIGILNTTTGYLVYSSAGHNPPFLIRQADQHITKLADLHGVVLGAMEKIEYGETILKVDRGTTILAYTDGVTESMNPQRQLFSEDRLIEVISRPENSSNEILATTLIDEVRRHENESDQADDITIMAISFNDTISDSVLDYLFTSLPGKLEFIPKLTAEFEVFANKHGVPLDSIQKIGIVFDELLSNTIKYGYSDENEHEIEVKIRFYKDKLTVTILDDGNPYNPFEQTVPDTTLSIPDRDIGGLGVHLVKFLVDDYHYEYRTQLRKNSIHFTKHI